MEKLYNDFRHYGTIIFDLEYEENGDYYRRMVITYNNSTKVFVLKNGNVIKVS